MESESFKQPLKFDRSRARPTLISLKAMANKSGGGPSHERESLKGPLLASGLVSGNAGASAGGHLLQHSFAASHYPGGRTAWEEAAPIIPSGGPTSGPLAFKRPSSAAQTAAEIRFRVKKASQATARPASHRELK